jgi:hypothetical protein
MDTSTLVENKLDAVRSLIRQLIADKVDVTAAAWVKPSADGDWQLYLVSKTVDAKGLGDAYRATYEALEKLPDPWIGMSEIKLVGIENPIARDILAARAQAPGKRITRYLGQELGGIPIEEAYIYSSSIAAFDVIARGKEEVIRYLEEQARKRAGSPGEYLLGYDDRGYLVAFISGFGFIGTGSISLGSHQLVVVDGIVVKVQS